MSLIIKKRQPYHGTHKYQYQAQAVYHAITLNQMNFLWYLPDSWCTILIKALHEEHLSLREQIALRIMVAFIVTPKQRYNFVSEWILPFFIETLEGENEDDYA